MVVTAGPDGRRAGAAGGDFGGTYIAGGLPTGDLPVLISGKGVITGYSHQGRPLDGDAELGAGGTAGFGGVLGRGLGVVGPGGTGSGKTDG
ncbi:MAG: hypothetical protein U0795_14680 [Pirellulales bacterium]